VKHFIDLHGGTVGMREIETGGLEVTCWLPAEATAHPMQGPHTLLAQAVN
jgi:signal transduction histidine kinase